jgi:hypothetical protein
MFQVGEFVTFGYHGKTRVVKVEKVHLSEGNMFVGPSPKLVTGWDVTSNPPTGGYRSFKVREMQDVR